VLTTPHHKKFIILRNIARSLGIRLIRWYDLNKGKRIRIILKWIFERLVGSIDWIDLAEDRERWLCLVKVIMNLWIL
jgi:hypothetical protein